MHMGLAAATLGMGDLAFARIEELAKRGSIFPSMVDGHNPGPKTLCDGYSATPEIVARMLMSSEMGKITLLPALPKALPNGNVKGLCVRGGFEVDIAWKDGKLTEVTIRSTTGTKTPVHYLDKIEEVSLQRQKTASFIACGRLPEGATPPPDRAGFERYHRV